MLLHSRAFGIAILILVLIISFVHLGVGISILKNFNQYGDIFDRERSLSIFNIVISVFGILISVFGIIAVAARRFTFSKVTAFGCLLIGLCALASLIAALAINFIGINHISSRFRDNMKQYKYSENARRNIDNIQRNYDCCGSNTWIDWDQILINTAPSNTNDVLTLNGAQETTTMSTTSFLSSDTTTMRTRTFSSSDTTTGQVTQTSSGFDWRRYFTTSGDQGITDTDVEAIVNGDSDTTTKPSRRTSTAKPFVYTLTTKQQSNFPMVDGQNSSTTTRSPYLEYLYKVGAALFSPQPRQKRQQGQSDYSNTYGSSKSYSVALPQSCCTRDAPLTANSLDSYCLSNMNNVANSFHHAGCSNKINRVAVGQALIIAFINGFLVVFAFIAIAILSRTYAGYVQPPKAYRDSSIQPSQLHEPNLPTEKIVKAAVINPHTDYSIYQ